MAKAKARRIVIQRRHSLPRIMLALFDSPGGHVAICLVLILLYGRYEGPGLPHDIALFAIGVLSRSMGSSAATVATAAQVRKDAVK